MLRRLSDPDFDAGSLIPGWSRREVVAHVGLNARALTRLTSWAATGIEAPMYSSPTARDEEIAFAATLPVQALRNLSDHAAIHLNVEWRDLEPEQWLAHVRTAQGRDVPASETVWMRTREVWIHAVDLGHGARFEDFPPALLDRLLIDVARTWARRNEADDPPVSMMPVDRPEGGYVPSSSLSDATMVSGSAAALVRWATGRGADGVTRLDGRPAPTAPRWL